MHMHICCFAYILTTLPLQGLWMWLLVIWALLEAAQHCFCILATVFFLSIYLCCWGKGQNPFVIFPPVKDIGCWLLCTWMLHVREEPHCIETAFPRHVKHGLLDPLRACISSAAYFNFNNDSSDTHPNAKTHAGPPPRALSWSTAVLSRGIWTLCRMWRIPWRWHRCGLAVV